MVPLLARFISIIVAVIPAAVCRRAEAQCDPSGGVFIGAPSDVREGQVVPLAFTLSVPVSQGTHCAVVVSQARFWLPSDPPDQADACQATNGILLPVPRGTVLEPSEFLRFACADSGVPNCVNAGDVNCEWIVEGLCYVASSSDAEACVLEVFGCWEGQTIPNDETVQMAASESIDIVISCLADLDGDAEVGPADLAQLLSAWGRNRNHPADLDENGSVGPEDLAALLSAWGPCECA